jgi:hypothetical protein
MELFQFFTELGVLGVAVFVLWRKLEASHKETLERLSTAETKLDVCEQDRDELRGRIIELERRLTDAPVRN